MVSVIQIGVIIVRKCKIATAKRRDYIFEEVNVHVYIVTLNGPALNFTWIVMLPHTRNIVVSLCNPVLPGIFPDQNSADRSNLPE